MNVDVAPAPAAPASPAEFRDQRPHSDLQVVWTRSGARLALLAAVAAGLTIHFARAWSYTASAGLAAGIFVVGFIAARRRAAARTQALRWSLTASDLVITSGGAAQRTLSIPRGRIALTQLCANPLERRFNLVRLDIFTFGVAKPIASIFGLKPAQAQAIQAALMTAGPADV